MRARYTRRRYGLSVFLLALLSLWAAPASVAAELRPQTVAAFDGYVRATEARMQAPDPFLWVESIPEPQRSRRLAAIKRGEFDIERLTTRDDGREIHVPDGLIHHWLGTVFVPGATVDQAVALLQDYDNHAEIYRPAVARSRLLAREGDLFRVYLRFYQKKVITVIVNSEHEARFSRPLPDRAQSRIYSTRIAEVEHPGTPEEREKPVGRDGGYLWRLYTYWRFLERDGGTYIQCEAITLTRSIPIAFRWLVGPFVTGIPRESLTFTLQTTRSTLMRRVGAVPGLDPGAAIKSSLGLTSQGTVRVPGCMPGHSPCLSRGVPQFLRRLTQRVCRHEFVRHFRTGRLWVECTRCGYESEGIDLKGSILPSGARS